MPEVLISIDDHGQLIVSLEMMKQWWERRNTGEPFNDEDAATFLGELISQGEFRFEE